MITYQLLASVFLDISFILLRYFGPIFSAMISGSKKIDLHENIYLWMNISVYLRIIHLAQ